MIKVFGKELEVMKQKQYSQLFISIFWLITKMLLTYKPVPELEVNMLEDSIRCFD